jgi:hypothetical protein
VPQIPEEQKVPEPEADPLPARHRPIPPPSEPKQYRAIGLVRGKYQPSEEKFTRGQLITDDGANIEAVLLGRVMSLVRNHLELENDHLWVVYPRTREKDDTQLHVQIVGVWEPETLNKPEATSEDVVSNGTPEAIDQASEKTETADLSPGFDDDYFSVRGEIVFHSPEHQQVVVKIQQVARKVSEPGKAFKLNLHGHLDSNKLLGYFWDLHVKRSETFLVITEGTCIGLVPPRKKSKDEARVDRKPTRKPFVSRNPVSRGGKQIDKTAPTRREPSSKPVKRTDNRTEQAN